MLSPTQRAQARHNLVRRMTERVRVGREVDGTDANGDATSVLDDVVYGGDQAGSPAQIKYVAGVVAGSAVTGQVVAMQRPILKVPSDSPLLAEGLAVHCVSSAADGILAGRRYRISGSPDAGQTSAHRYPLIELS